MSWFSLEVTAPEGRRAAVAAWLVMTTGHAVEERDDGIIVSFAPDAAAAAELTRKLDKAFEGAVRASGHPLPDVDWTVAWRAGLGPRPVGRLVLVPTWVEYTPGPGEIPLLIDPETAFGSGEHGSTRGALRLLDRFLKPGDAVLDLGAGSGILTIAAAKLGAVRAVGVESDPEALPVAERNAARNGVSAVARFLEGDAALFAPLLGPADIVVANILRTVNLHLLTPIHRALRRGGTAICAGMEQAEATEFRAPLLAAGFEIRQELLDDGWWSVAAERV